MSPLAAVAAALCTALLPAHGGQYRGPGTPVPPGSPLPVGMPRPPVTGGPGRPAAGVPPGTPSPLTGSGVPIAIDEVNWETWWEHHKDPFLQQRRAATAPVTGSDDFYLGPRRAENRLDVLAPTETDLVGRIVPVLARLLAAERNPDVATACLVALGKIGRDAPGLDLEQLLAAQIARDDQEVRETAVLALGIAGRPAALAPLLALLRDDAAGRRLVARTEVGGRTRAFAAYALGLLGARSGELATRQQVHDALWPLLQDRHLRDRDLRVAAISALGILCGGPQGERTAGKRLVWQTVEELLGFLALDLGAGDELVQAHAPIAIARLLGRGTSDLHQKCKARFTALLADRDRRGHWITQSAAIALGGLAVPAEAHAEDGAVAAALQQHWERGRDRLARYFGAIALGRIGGAANRDWLLRTYAGCHKSTERPWVGLALGLGAAGAGRDGAGKADAVVADLLLADLKDSPSQDVQGALAVALGLTGHQAAVPAVLRLLGQNEGNERLAGHLCSALGLLGDRAAAPALLAVLERSARRPFLLLQAAQALGRLGDVEAAQRLVGGMQEAESTAVLAALAVAIGQIGDRRSIEPLVVMAGDAELTKIARSFVAAALGGVGDKDPLRWNLPFLRDGNHAAAVDTLTNGSTGVLDIL